MIIGNTQSTCCPKLGITGWLVMESLTKSWRNSSLKNGYTFSDEPKQKHIDHHFAHNFSGVVMAFCWMPMVETSLNNHPGIQKHLQMDQGTHLLCLSK